MVCHIFWPKAKRSKATHGKEAVDARASGQGRTVEDLNVGNQLAEFRKPRGLRFAPNGHICCVAQDEVVAFDFISGECLGVIVRLPRLNGQALAFFP